MAEVAVPATGARAENRLRVRAAQLAQARGDVREAAPVAQTVEQALGAERPGREDDLLGGEGSFLHAAGPARADHVAAAGPRPDVMDGGQRMDGRARPLGQVQIVLDQGVLGVVPAARHAGPAQRAGPPSGTGPAEERVRRCGAGFVPEQDPHRRTSIGVPDPELLGDGSQRPVGVRLDRVHGHAEHASGLVVVRREGRLPVRDRGPLRIGVERVRRLVERVRVTQRATADPGARHDQHVLEQGQSQDAVATERGRIHVVAQPPGRLGELLVGEAAAGFEDADAIALLGQAQRGHAAPEPGADHEDVVVVRHRRSITPLLATCQQRVSGLAHLANPPAQRCRSAPWRGMVLG